MSCILANSRLFGSNGKSTNIILPGYHLRLDIPYNGQQSKYFYSFRPPFLSAPPPLSLILRRSLLPLFFFVVPIIFGMVVFALLALYTPTLCA